MGLRNNLKIIRMRDYQMEPGEFANMLGISIKTYSGWEHNHSRPPLEKAIEIADKLNKDVKEIWYRE